MHALTGALVLIWVLRAEVHAAPSVSDLHACVSAAFASGSEAHATAETDALLGMHTVLRAKETVFLLKGDAQVFPQAYTARECLGYMAAGARNVQVLELVLRSQEGHILARSREPAALAFLRHCGVPGEVVFATVRVADGQGEVVFGAWPTQQQHPMPVRRMENCAALGNPRPAPLSVGPEPPGQSIEHQLETLGLELGRLGYGSGKLVAFGALRAGQHAANGVLLSRQHCYALVGVGSDDVVDLDLRVFGPTLPLTVAGLDVSRGRSAQVKLCSEAPARYVVDVAAFQGEGAYAVSALELTEPEPAPGIDGAARIEYAELVARMQSRGFEARVLTSGVVAQEEKLQVPLELLGGACMAIGAVRVSDDAAGSGLMLGLTAMDGELLAMDGPSREPPLLFHCASQAERVQAVVGTAQGRAQARFALVVGREPATEQGAP